MFMSAAGKASTLAEHAQNMLPTHTARLQALHQRQDTPAEGDTLMQERFMGRVGKHFVKRFRKALESKLSPWCPMHHLRATLEHQGLTCGAKEDNRMTCHDSSIMLCMGKDLCLLSSWCGAVH